ncbi:DNA-processing protein DprA [Nonomuraea sp. NBC_01738]|uniref:DNA-processing protein DprA n=1 Tax=Nonomuraea sp. NBC_01738 TaxID=2976003 RepID=UPI002E0DF0B4|nr:DNA-processing protein DprA [Nonomuraea sp. NBC_01738]
MIKPDCGEHRRTHLELSEDSSGSHKSYEVTACSTKRLSAPRRAWGCQSPIWHNTFTPTTACHLGNPGTVDHYTATHPVTTNVGVDAYVQAETTFEMVMTVTTIDEQTAVLALTQATHSVPWHYTARAIASAGSACKILDEDLIGLDEGDRVHAVDIASRVEPEDLRRTRNLIITMQAHGIDLVTILDDTYPGNMLWANNYQPFLWIRGQLNTEDYRAVAVVGERDSTLAAAAAQALAHAGLTVVAPLDTDLDAAVHEAALAVGGHTLGVLSGGIAEPSTLGQYANVAQQIVERGALVSQFWPDTARADQTTALARIVTCGLAATIYIADGCDGGSSHRYVESVLKTGKHVFVPQWLQQEQPWVTRAGFRGGITAVQDIDDLSKQAVNLIDMSSQSTMF